MNDRIRWTDNGYGGYLGHVGTVEHWLFQVWHDRPAGWKLQSATMPGMPRIRGRGDGPDALKATAEEWLAEFVSSLGAVFPADERRRCAGIIRRAAAHLAGDDKQMRAYRESAMTMADLIDPSESEAQR